MKKAEGASLSYMCVEWGNGTRGTEYSGRDSDVLSICKSKAEAG
jgi:hypothetical protein